MVHTLQDLGLELGRIRELMDTRVPGLSHAELLARGGLYARLYELQFGEIRP